MRLRQSSLLITIAVLILTIALTVSPAFSRQSHSTAPLPAQVEPLNAPGLWLADRGCDGAREAQGSLRTAERALRRVRREGENLRRALEDTTTALRAVDRHIDRRC